VSGHASLLKLNAYCLLKLNAYLLKLSASSTLQTSLAEKCCQDFYCAVFAFVGLPL
jgi:hypothetical protein